MAAMSLLWTGWSYTADKRVGGRQEEEAAAPSEGDEEKIATTKVGGVVLNNDTYGAADVPTAESTNEDDHDAVSDPSSFNNSWKLNAILALVSCWYAMALTGWGTVEKRGNIANPDVGEVSMWMLIVSQWIAMLLYLWTLIAPLMCPHRDFS